MPLAETGASIGVLARMGRNLRSSQGFMPEDARNARFDREKPPRYGGVRLSGENLRDRRK
jgi:hypothetical protein